MKNVDVIIPTYNREKLLSITLPTYLQINVNRLIVVDDCSSDNTYSVVMELKKFYSRIEYYRLPRKGYQMTAKNYGIKISTAKYLYFGDDDSVLLEDSISNMLELCTTNTNTIIGARHIYLTSNNYKIGKIEDYDKYPSSYSDIFNKDTMKLDLSYITHNTNSLPYCQSCFMIPRNMAINNSFDENFFGTCYREETDYIIGLRVKSNANLMICDSSLQINLPKMICSGGTSSVNKYYRHYSEIINEYKFFKKNRVFISNYVTFNTNPLVCAVKHLLRKILNFLKYLFSL